MKRPVTPAYTQRYGAAKTRRPPQVAPPLIGRGRPDAGNAVPLPARKPNRPPSRACIRVLPSRQNSLMVGSATTPPQKGRTSARGAATAVE